MLVLLAPLLACTPAGTVSAPSGDVIIGGHSYRLPDEAFADGMVDHGLQDSLLLELPVPVKDGVEPATVQLLLLAPKTSNERERERRVDAHIKLGAQVSATLDSSDAHFSFKQSSPRVPDAPPQMVQVVTSRPAGAGNLDVFVRPPITEAKEFIDCSYPVGDLPGLVCHQEFAAPGMAVRASYDRRYVLHSDELRTYVLFYLRTHSVI